MFLLRNWARSLVCLVRISKFLIARLVIQCFLFAEEEMIFNLEEDLIPENSIPVISQGGLLNPQLPKLRQKSPQRLRINTKARHVI